MPSNGYGRVMADKHASDAEEQVGARALSSRLGEIVMSVALLATAVSRVAAAVLHWQRRPAGPGFFPFALGGVLEGLSRAGDPLYLRPERRR